MKKESLLTIILSVTLSFLFIGGAMYVFSWSEPSTAMPSNYVPPVNTSATGQSKLGELSVSLLRDTDNNNYYLNPSGASLVQRDICSEEYDMCFSDLEDLLKAHTYLYGQNHTEANCEALGGEVIDNVCKFALTECPTGWTWSGLVSCPGGYGYTQPAGGSPYFDPIPWGQGWTNCYTVDGRVSWFNHCGCWQTETTYYVAPQKTHIGCY